MRVLFDSYIFRAQRVGGISRYFAELIRRLPGLGVKPRLFTPFVDNEHALSAGLTWRGSSRFLSSHKLLRRGAFAVMTGADRLLEGWSSYDILHRTYYSSGSRSTGRTVCTIVDMIPELFPQYFRGGNPHQEKRRLATDADVIFSISENTSRDVVVMYGCDPSKVVTTPLGIDVTRFVSPPHATNPFRPPYLLFVGSRAGYKNFDRFAEATGQVLLGHSSLSLALVGAGQLDARERELFRRMGVLERVHQADVTDADLPKIYSEAEVFVFPSEYEGFGLPLLEAFATRCPVAASRASCFPEIGGAAIEYFDPASVDEIAGAVERVVGSSARAAELRALGSERAKLFSWDRTAALTAAAYRRLCGLPVAHPSD